MTNHLHSAAEILSQLASPAASENFSPFGEQPLLLLDLQAATAPQVERLQAFLENTDFRALRAEHPALRGGAGIVVRLERSCSGAVEWLIVEGG